MSPDNLCYVMELPYTDIFSPAMEGTLSRPADTGMVVCQEEMWQMHIKPGRTAGNHTFWVLQPSQTLSGVSSWHLQHRGSSAQQAAQKEGPRHRAKATTLKVPKPK